MICSATSILFPLYPLLFCLLSYLFSALTFPLPLPQTEVDNGIPLPTCLFLFSKWLRQLKEERGVCLMEPGQQYSHNLELCALATWSGEESQYFLEESSHIHQQLISFQTGTLVCVCIMNAEESRSGSLPTLTSGLI